MAKKGKKIIKMILVIALLFNIWAIFNKSYASEEHPEVTDGGTEHPEVTDGGTEQRSSSWWDEITGSASNFLQMGEEHAASGNIKVQTGEGNSQVTISTPSDSEIQAIINDIFNILFPLGVGITVIIGGVLGIKFMLASAEDKAKVKESLVPYVIGCAVIYGAFGIWKLAITIFSALG